MARIQIEHLTKDFAGPRGEAVRALADVSLEVHPGEWLALLGPSGCGKTTLLRLVAGLEQPTTGSISLDGVPLRSVPPGERDVSMVFQYPGLYPHLSVYENMAFGLRVRRCPPPEADRRVRAAAEMLGIGEWLHQKPATLSGGQAQRVALGRALVRRPKVFLFDEPLSNLDVQSRGQMRSEFLRLRGQLDAAVVYVTHDQSEAMSLGQRLAVMNRGRIEQIGRPLEVYEHPANLFVGGFTGTPAMNFLRGLLRSGPGGFVFESETKDISLPLVEELSARLQSNHISSVLLGVRPEHLLLSNSPDSGVIGAIVEAVEPLGADTLLHVRVGAQKLVARAPASCLSQRGDSIQLAPDLRCASIFDAQTGVAFT